jgi:hypothetical protein
LLADFTDEQGRALVNAAVNLQVAEKSVAKEDLKKKKGNSCE